MSKPALDSKIDAIVKRVIVIKKCHVAGAGNRRNNNTKKWQCYTSYSLRALKAHLNQGAYGRGGG
jgi:hypothetical protein